MMYTTATAANRVILEPLMKAYTSELDTTSQSASFRFYTRKITKKYKYVGLTESAAATIAAEKLAQYNRTFYQWFWTGSYWLAYSGGKRVSYKSQCATVSIVKDSGSMYHVEISVDERTNFYRQGFLADLTDAQVEAELVAMYPGRDYDE